MILSVNTECFYILTHDGPKFFQTVAEMQPIMNEESRRITLRVNPLDRWEAWEVPDSDHGKMVRLLMGRAKTHEEKALVRRYSSTLSGASIVDSVKSDG